MISLVGGSGFVGTSVANRLSAIGRDFTILDTAENPRFRQKFRFVDVRDLEILSGFVAKSQAIVNLAAVHRDDVRPRSLYDQVNVQGARNVCEAARENDIRKIIFTSSVAVYGFAPVDTNETGARDYFNDYGRTKSQAEDVYREWQAEDPDRSLTIVRPTVIFGERNRGNVYNLLRQIASGRFLMVGNGHNVKSMAYVENVAAFLVHSLSFGRGVHLYNYVDKPDMTMNELVEIADRMLGRDPSRRIRLPYWLGFLGGMLYDGLARITGRRYAISSIRVKKFCSDTQFAADRVSDTGFVPPIEIREALERTIRHEFLEDHRDEPTYETE